jgi:hypothetical protein
MAVTYIEAGAGVTAISGADPAPAIPTTNQAADDLLIIQAAYSNDPLADTISTPTDWTLLYGPDDAPDGVVFDTRQYLFGRIDTGSLSGTVTLTVSGSAVTTRARIYRFRGTATSSYTESGSYLEAADASIEIPSVTTSAADGLAVAFVHIADDNAVASATGETGGDYTEAVAEYLTTTGNDGCLQLQIAAMASAGTISGGIISMGASDAWGCRAFGLTALVVAAAPGPTMPLKHHSRKVAMRSWQRAS